MDQTLKSSRFYSMDALRAFAMIFGIYMHSTHSFFIEFWTGVQDASATVLSTIVLIPSFYIPSLFRMQTFFLVAGFFARMLFHRDGLKGMLVNRAKRVGIPFLFGLAVLVPWVYILRLYGRTRRENPDAFFPWAEIVPYFSSDLFFKTYAPHYLWFLYFLLILYILFMTLRAIFVWVDRDETWAKWLDRRVFHITLSQWGPLQMVLPMVVVMAFIQGPFISEIGLSFIPQTGLVMMYGLFFWMGWMIHRQTAVMEHLARNWRANALNGLGVLLGILLIAGMVFVWVGFPIDPSVDPAVSESSSAQTNAPVQPNLEEGEMPDFSRLPLEAKIGLYIYRVVMTYFMWTFTFALVGLFVTFFSRPSPMLRYIADSSYWLYLAHVPLILWMQIEIAYWSWHWLSKIIFLNFMNLLVLLILYHYGVRSTMIGVVLNGRRYPRRRPWKG